MLVFDAIDFKVVGVNHTSSAFLRVRNPSDEPIFVQTLNLVQADEHFRPLDNAFASEHGASPTREHGKFSNSPLMEKAPRPSKDKSFGSESFMRPANAVKDADVTTGPRASAFPTPTDVRHTFYRDSGGSATRTKQDSSRGLGSDDMQEALPFSVDGSAVSSGGFVLQPHKVCLCVCL